MATEQARNYRAEYARRAQRARERGTTFYKSRPTPARPLDAIRNPVRWQGYIRRNLAKVERLLNSREGLLICLKRALGARAENRLPVFATKIRDITGEGRPHSIGRTPHDVDGYVAGSFLEPTDETGGFGYSFVHREGFAIEICNDSSDLIEQLVGLIRSRGWSIPAQLARRVTRTTGYLAA